MSSINQSAQFQSQNSGQMERCDSRQDPALKNKNIPTRKQQNNENKANSRNTEPKKK
jgi:hypothetical protein